MTLEMQSSVILPVKFAKLKFPNYVSLGSMSSPDTPLSPPPEPYEIRAVTKDDSEKILDHLRRFFFRDEPLNIDVGLLEERDTCSDLEAYSMKTIEDGVSLMVVTSSGKVIGVCLNGIIRKNEKPETTKIEDEKFSKIVSLLEHVDKEVDVFGRYPDIDRQMIVAVLSVDSTWRGQGIAKKLMNRSREMACKHGIKFMRGDCTSHFTAKALARLGFECIYKLKYEDYKVEGVQVFKPESPHAEVCVFVQEIS